MNKNKTYMLLYISIMSVMFACKGQTELDLLTDKAQPSPLLGKAKAIKTTDAFGNKITTEWVYDATTKQIIGSKITDSLAKTSNTEIFKRDMDGKMLSVSIEKKAADGTKTQSEKVYKYDGSKLVSITETLATEQIIDEFGYDTEGKLIKMTHNSVKSGKTNVLQLVNYSWTKGNVTGITDRSLMCGYEEIDLQYNTGENLLAKFYKEELKLNAFSPEILSQNLPASSVKLFEGSKYKYEYEYNKENKIVGYKTLVNKGGVWQTFSAMQVFYYE
jgi:hypothetical protein